MSEIVEYYGESVFSSRELSAGMRMSQYFVPRDSVLKRIGVFFNTRGDSPNTIHFNITTAEGHILLERVINAANIIDNNFSILDLDLNVRKGYMHAINMIGIGGQGRGVWFRWGPSKHCNRERLYMLDVNTNNNEMYCFMVYEETPKVVIQEQPVRSVPDTPVAAEIKQDDIVPTEVPKPPPPPSLNVVQVEERQDEEDDAPSIRSDVKAVKGKVSVVVRHHNTSGGIEATLNSIYAQTYKHVGVVIVDDGSMNREREALTLLVRKYDRQYGIRIINIKKSKGAGKAYNTGAESSDGEFLLFCESGVVLEPDYFFEALNSFHEKDDVGWVYCDHKNGDSIVTAGKFDKDTLGDGYCHLTSMMRGNLFPGFNPKTRVEIQTGVFQKIAAKGFKGEWLNTPLFKIMNINYVM